MSVLLSTASWGLKFLHVSFQCSFLIAQLLASLAVSSMGASQTSPNRAGTLCLAEVPSSVGVKAGYRLVGKGQS